MIVSKKITTNQLITRYILTGGGLGLYFGLFFRPARQPNLWFVLAMAGLVTLVMMTIEVWQKRPSFGHLIKTTLSTYIKVCLFLILLELRHPLYALGGRIGVTLFMTIMGALAGLWYAYEKIRQKRPS